MMTLKKSAVELRFWAKVNIKGPNDCWVWKAACTPSGYGVFGFDGTNAHRAHRVAWKITYGSIPEDMFVCHHCDNKKCVNPVHLFLGSNSINQLDRIQKITTKNLKDRTKFCIRCQKRQPFKLFHKARRGMNGLRSICISCEKYAHQKRKALRATSS